MHLKSSKKQSNHSQSDCQTPQDLHNRTLQPSKSFVVQKGLPWFIQFCYQEAGIEANHIRQDPQIWHASDRLDPNLPNVD